MASFWRKPALLRDHPNFFFIFIATILFHVALAFIGIFGKPPNFASPSLIVVNGFASPWVWGLASAAIACCLIVGLYRTHWKLARLALAAGAALTMWRAILIATPLIEGTTKQGLTALPVWALAAALHLSQTAEPPHNPETATR